MVPSDGHNRELPHQHSVSCFMYLQVGKKEKTALLIPPETSLFSLSCPFPSEWGPLGTRLFHAVLPSSLRFLPPLTASPSLALGSLVSPVLVPLSIACLSHSYSVRTRRYFVLLYEVKSGWYKALVVRKRKPHI